MMRRIGEFVGVLIAWGLVLLACGAIARIGGGDESEIIAATALLVAMHTKATRP